MTTATFDTLQDNAEAKFITLTENLRKLINKDQLSMTARKDCLKN